MIKFQYLPQDLRRRVADPHDPLGRWAFVHPALALCLPMPIYRSSSGKSGRPRFSGWSFTVTFCGAVTGSLELVGEADALAAHNGRLAAEAVHQRLEELAARLDPVVYRPALLLDPELRMRYLWLRAPGERERFVAVVGEFRVMTRAEFEADRTERRAHIAIRVHP